jgi:uncharacterized protein YndB with AHSA1/START domain
MPAIVRAFAASPEDLFEAWIDPQIMHQWLFVTPTSEIVEIDLAPRTGGTFSLIEQCADGMAERHGRFDAVIRPRRIAFTIEGEPPVDVVLASCGPGCRLTLHAADAMPRWDAMLDQLARIISAR